MSSALETIPMYLVIYGSAFLWALAGVFTYKPHRFRGWIVHTVIFIMISLLAAFIAAKICFATVDDSYSASNINALGLLYLYWLMFFAAACLLAVFGNLGKYFNRESRDPQPKQEQNKPEK